MKVKVGSKNTVKIEAVRETLRDYPKFSESKIEGISVDSGVSDQPKTLKETIDGARNRAENSFDECEYGFGVESGLMKVPGTKTGIMNITVCAIYDGKQYHVGTAPAFEYPPEVTRLVFEENLNINQAFYRAGLTDNPKLGNEEGVIGVLTKRRMDRKEVTKQAVVMALIHLEHSDLY